MSHRERTPGAPVRDPADGGGGLAAWMPPAIVAATAVSIVGGFYLGGPGLGMAAGGLSASAIVVMAVRHPPKHPIVPAPLHDLRRHVLLVLLGPLEDGHTISQIGRLCGDSTPPTEIRVLVPRAGSTLARWSGDRRTALALAQRRCVLSIASLATAGLGAEASVGDEDVVLAVQDELHTFPATDVILVTPPEESGEEEEIASELRSRLQTDFLHLASSPLPPPPPASRHAAAGRHGGRR
jgi:hypothetical protein